MSDYSQITNFTAKDALSTGDAEKIISGADVDAELSAISTAITSKYDSNDIASQAQAEALSSNAVLMTPLAVSYVLEENAGALGDIQALTDPNADRILFWDDVGTAGVTWLTIGDGLEISTTTLQLPSSLAGNGLTLTSGVLAVVGGNGITANANDIALTDAAASTSNPVDVTSGSITLDLEALTTIEGNALAATDTFLVDDGGTPKGLEYQDMGLRVQTGKDAGSPVTLAASDMNTIMEFNAAATVNLPLNSSVPLPVGSFVVLVVDSASAEVTVTAAASVTLNSIFHPGGTVAASDKVRAGGTAVAIKVAADEWYLSGDIVNS